ncbi:helix-turn-helix domain-containing protein [Sporosarcina luteola]|uniref:helix-turn-helix domain-containing protein n=1 Tax=Sporosarcina luteola TaxID=582850 RepID=UPI00203F0C46|nr:helix-turn-helix domain-containing protein [Sporosarcina luteola]MCM3710911.1 helix-turn-helix domain-containing protein [Sporosarcina luteola]
MLSNKVWFSDQVKKGKTLTDVSEYLNVTKRTVYNWEKKHGLKLKRNARRERTNFFNEDFFVEIDNEEKAYILGFVMADGCIGSHGRSLDIKLQASDIDILYKINAAMCSSAKITDRANGKYKTVSLCSKKMILDLEKYTVTNSKSSTLLFPVLENVELYRHFIRGFFDGDGHIGFRQCALVIGSPSFFDSFMSFLKHNFDFTPWHANKGNYFLIQLSRKDSWFIKWLYNDCSIYLDRKFKSYIDNWKAYQNEGTELEDKKPSG